MSYQVIQRDNLGDFEIAVRQAMSEGWKPHGGVAVTFFDFPQAGGYDERGFIWAQAMVKESSLRKSPAEEYLGPG